MSDFEKLGVFYLGRKYDLKTKKSEESLILYDSKDLTTHAMCVGMTGSGKTGLCLALLEEAAIDGIPALIIDPKGDLGNLMLTFPELRPEDFRPWVNEDEARKKNLSADDFAKQQAELWKNGLAKWGQDGARIQRLKEAAEVAVYTPGSTAGLPLSILQSFSAPTRAIIDDTDAMRERVASTTTSLLGLLGIDADPIKSREHILISNVLNYFWTQGKDLDLGGLIQAIQTPPMNKIGVFEMDSFYPAKERFELAMSINNLLAAPGFQGWLEGEALDIQRMLYTSTGKPRHAIFSIAHLSDPERMFFVSLLFNQTLAWVRAQPGTTSLRALLYMDELFGYMPPVANPPSKAPLLTLLKQARAFGLGIVLATQNPVDLDYKGLSNIGTWFLGRLQTERDKARVLEGLEGASASGGGKFQRFEMEQILAGLGNRVFLLHNVHEDAPEVFETRWAMSYLCGPLTRMQIKVLMDAKRGASPAATTASAKTVAVHATANAQRPALPAEVPQVFLPVRGRSEDGAQLVYQPFLLGMAKAHYDEAKKNINLDADCNQLIPVTNEAVMVKWEQAVPVEIDESDLMKESEGNAFFGELPKAAGQAKSYASWKKEFGEEIYRSQKLELFKSPSTGELSQVNESERDFRIRITQLGREQRDEWTEKLREKYAKKMEAIEDRIRRAEERVQREQQQAQQQKLQTAISVGATILGAFLGRKAVSRSTLGKASTAVRSASRAMREGKEADLAEDNLEALQQQLADLEAEFKAETEAYAAKSEAMNETLETIAIRPKKTNISVRLFALAWAPFWMKEEERVEAWK